MAETTPEPTVPTDADGGESRISGWMYLVGAAVLTAATTWSIGGVNVLSPLIAVAFVGRLGRKPLLPAGLVGMGLSLAVVGIAFVSLDDVTSAATGSGTPSEAAIVTLVALVAYIASFALSLGPIVWTVINEVFPRAIRGRAVSVATAVNWFSAWGQPVLPVTHGVDR